MSLHTIDTGRLLPRRITTLFLAAMVALVMVITPQGSPARADSPWETTIETGKVNVLKLRATDFGVAALALEHTSPEGATEEYLHDEVLVRVPASTHTDSLPEQLGVPSGYHLDANGPLTLGWDVSAIREHSYDSSNTKIRAKGPKGARVFIHAIDPQGELLPVLEGGKREVDGETRLVINDMSWVNTAWTFTQPGTYVFHLAAQAQRTNASTFTTRNEATLTIHVGDGEASTEGLVDLQGPSSTQPAPSDDDNTVEEDGEEGENLPPVIPPGTHPHPPATGNSPSQPEAGTPSTPAGPDKENAFTGDTPSPTAPDPHDTDPVTDRDMLYRTHVDAAHMYWDKASQSLAVGVIDGATLRPADDVVVRLGPDADEVGREVSRIKVPKGQKYSFLGAPGTILWNAPGQFYRGWRPVWAGYGSGEMPAKVARDSLRLDLVGVEGPGEMIVWRSGGDFVAEDFNSANPEKRTMPMVPGGHGHLNWSFTKEGRYTTKWRARAATTDGASLTSDVYEVIWLVGHDENVGLPKGTTAGAMILTPADAQDQGTPGEDEDSSGDEAEKPSEEAEAPEAGSYVCLAPGHHDLRVSTDPAGKVSIVLKDDSGAKPVERQNYTVVVPVPDIASHSLDLSDQMQPLKILGKTGTRVWSLPEIQRPLLPWLGMSTEGVNYSTVNSEGIKVSIEDFTGPGRLVQWDGGAISPVNIHLDSKNYDTSFRFTSPTHRHFATSFNAPGLYEVDQKFAVTHTPASGLERDYQFFATYFAVGDASVDKLCPGYRKAHGLDKDTAPKIDPPKDKDQGATPGDNRPGQGSDSGKDKNTPGGGHGGQPLPPANPPKAPQSATQCMPDGVDVVLDSGHTDLFNVTVNAEGKLDLVVKEDVTGSHVIRPASSVLVKVKETAKHEFTAQQQKTLGIPAQGYLLPQTQQPGLIWPGWDTNAVKDAGLHKTAFDVTYSGPEGGRIHMWLSSIQGTPEKGRVQGGGNELDPKGSVILQDYPAHTHANWLFTRPGRYTLNVTARVSSEDGTRTQTTPTRTYIIDVDSVNCPTVNVSNTTVAQGEDVTFTATNLPAGTRATFQVHSTVITLTPVTVGTDGTARTTWKVPANFEVGEHHVSLVEHPELRTTFTVTAATKQGGAPQGNTAAPAAPNTAGKPASPSASGGGASSSSGGAKDCVATTITREATPEEAEKLKNGGNTTGNTNAQANTASTVLTFTVGSGEGNANDGHFDLGPAIENNTLVARVKDDRAQPASWVDPTTLTFGLGDAAKLNAPDALSFVATPGKPVWMIPSTQIPGVPWLGLNSQREEIVNGTKGGVTFTLDAVDGPGKVAVFAAGSLGSGVGEHVFDAAGSSYVLPANTHAHYNWVFTEPGTYTMKISMKVTPTGADLAGSGGASATVGITPTGKTGPNGRPMVSEVVGRTKSGKECSLASTGANTSDLVLLTLVMALLGGVGVVVSRRRAR